MINFLQFPTRALNSTQKCISAPLYLSSQKLPPPKTNKKNTHNKQESKKKKKILWHEARKHVGWRWRHLRRITTSMTALLSERVVIVLLYPYRATPHNLTPHRSEPRRVASRRVAIFHPPHRTFEVWAKWHAVYCWRVLELRSARTYQLICGARNYPAKAPKNIARARIACTRQPNIYI